MENGFWWGTDYFCHRANCFVNWYIALFQNGLQGPKWITGRINYPKSSAVLAAGKHYYNEVIMPSSGVV
jgi:hypothetical protein